MKTNKNNITALSPAIDTSDKRLFGLLTRLSENPVGAKLLQSVESMEPRYNIRSHYCFDHQMENPGLLWRRIINNRLHCRVHLNPHLSDDYLSVVLCHETRHIVQGNLPMGTKNLPQRVTEELINQRLREADAFTFQTIYALEEWRHKNAAAPYEHCKTYFQEKMSAQDFERYLKAGQDYLNAEKTVEKDAAIETLFWSVQPALHHYDSYYFDSFDEKKFTDTAKQSRQRAYPEFRYCHKTHFYLSGNNESVYQKLLNCLSDKTQIQLQQVQKKLAGNTTRKTTFSR